MIRSFLIDPSDITDFDRDQFSLELFWMFCLVVAGKTATTQARLLNSFLEDNKREDEQTPFDIVRRLDQDGDLFNAIKDSRLGQYNRLEKAIKQSLVLDLSNDPLDTFESISGVGPKTARYFVLHTRPDQQIAVLDTHILRHMRDKGLTTQKTTPPTGSKYAELEKAFIGLAGTAGMSIADYDLHIWRIYSGNRSQKTVRGKTAQEIDKLGTSIQI